MGIQCDANKLLQVTAVVAKAEIRRLLCHGGGEPHFFIVLPEHQHATWQNVWICGIKQGYFGSVVMSKYTSPVVLTKSGKMWAYYTLCLRLWFSVDDKPFRQRMLSNLLIVPLYSPDKNWVFLPNHSTNQQLYQHMGTSETLSAFVSTLEKTRLGGVRVGSFLSCNLEWDYQRCEHFRQQREKHFVRAAAVEVWQKRYGYISPFLKMIRDWERYYDSDNSI